MQLWKARLSIPEWQTATSIVANSYYNFTLFFPKERLRYGIDHTCKASMESVDFRIVVN